MKIVQNQKLKATILNVQFLIENGLTIRQEMQIKIRLIAITCDLKIGNLVEIIHDARIAFLIVFAHYNMSQAE